MKLLPANIKLDSRLEQWCLCTVILFGISVAVISFASYGITLTTGQPPFPVPGLAPEPQTIHRLGFAGIGMAMAFTYVYFANKFPNKIFWWVTLLVISYPLGSSIARVWTPLITGTLTEAWMSSSISLIGLIDRTLICSLLILMLLAPLKKRFLSIIAGISGIFLMALNTFVLLGHIKSIPFLYDFRVSLPNTIIYFLFGMFFLIGTLPFPGLLYPLLSPKPLYRILTCLSLVIGMLLVGLGIFNIVSFQPAFEHHQLAPDNLRIWYWQLSFPNVIIAVLICSLSLKLIKAYQGEESVKEQLETANTELEVRVEERTNELRENQQSLEKANAELRSLMVELSEIARVREYALEGISRLDVNGVYQMMNTAYASMAGYTQEELVGETWKKTVSPDMFDELKPIFDQMLQTGKAQCEVKGLKKNGDVFFKEVVLIRQLDDKGEYAGHYCFAKDITERRQLENSLNKTLLQLRELERLFSLSSDIICIVDFEGHILMVNPSFERLLGYSLDEIEGKLSLDLIHPDDRERARHEYQNILKGYESIDFEYRYRAKDGQYRWLAWTTSMDPSTQRLYAVARDCTERKQADQEIRFSYEKLQEIERQRVTYISSLTHDLRTPLIAQRHALSMLQESAEYSDEESAGLAAGLLKNNENLLDLVNRLLESYQYEDGKIPFTFEPIALYSLVEEVRYDVQPLLVQKQASLEIDIPENVPLLLGDKYHLKRVFQNLIGNSMEHLPANGGLVRIIAFEDNERVKIVIQDNGNGIDPDILPVLFERYLMGATRKRKIGSGLGLYICRLILEKHGGMIRVNNRQPQGAEFTLLLPKSPFEELIDVQPTYESFERHNR